jgi:hypothetical protein
MKTLFLILMTAGSAFAGDYVWPTLPGLTAPSDHITADFQARRDHNYEQARQDAFNQDILDRLDAIAGAIGDKD